MGNLKEFAMNAIINSPALKGSPQAQEFLNAVQSGDNTRGEQMADNICQAYGLTREQALDKAMRGLGLRR